MEFLILSALQFDLTFPTALRFLERYSKILGDHNDVITYAQFLMELALIDVRMIHYPCSILAAAALTESFKVVSTLRINTTMNS